MEVVPPSSGFQCGGSIYAVDLFILLITYAGNPEYLLQRLGEGAAGIPAGFSQGSRAQTAGKVTLGGWSRPAEAKSAEGLRTRRRC